MSSSSFSVVVLEQSAETLIAEHLVVAVGRWSTVDEPILQPLMISLAMIMVEVGSHGASQLTLREQDHSGEALRFHREHKSLAMRIQVGTPRRQLHRLHTR